MKLLHQRVYQKNKHEEIKCVEGPPEKSGADRMPTVGGGESGFAEGFGGTIAKGGKGQKSLTKALLSRRLVSRAQGRIARPFYFGNPRQRRYTKADLIPPLAPSNTERVVATS